ncbi:MAG: SagB/ThcOx family dehydrogenase [Candidatus Coatesbacteria bacterium]|nr:SagB/ThcOx family dehydrogenase [Candidatus Coatesbacteria bacterium]
MCSNSNKTSAENNDNSDAVSSEIVLPSPSKDGKVSVEKALQERRSIRRFKDTPLSLGIVSQMMWAAYGTTNERGFKTTPSAGAIYPLEFYVAISKVEGIEAGLYKYNSLHHKLKLIKSGDLRKDLSEASLGQSCIKNASFIIIFTAVFGSIKLRYGNRGIQYTHNEVGHAGQNIYLQAVSLNIGTVVVGAFVEEKVKAVLDLKDNQSVLYMMPVGQK